MAGSIERVDRLLNETGDEQTASRLKIELAGLIENVHGAVKGQVAFMVDMAKADALVLLGENRQAFELVDRHV